MSLARTPAPTGLAHLPADLQHASAMLLEQHLQAPVKTIVVNLQESCSCNDTRARDHSGRSGDIRELLARISPFGGSMECKRLADAASSSPAGELVGEMNPHFGPCCRWWCWQESSGTKLHAMGRDVEARKKWGSRHFRHFRHFHAPCSLPRS